jgi:exodeoxyribonuclease VIII
MRERVMLDIETLSCEPNAVVTAIGVAFFDEDQVTRTCVGYLNYKTDTGHIDPRTVRWWLEQDADIRTLNLMGLADPAEFAPGLADLLDGRTVWGNGPQFDCTIMRNWFGRLGVKCPWHFRDERDCRTMFEIGRSLDVPYPEKQNAHDALADAVWQAEYVLAVEARIYQGMRG